MVRPDRCTIVHPRIFFISPLTCRKYEDITQHISCASWRGALCSKYSSQWVASASCWRAPTPASLNILCLHCFLTLLGDAAIGHAVAGAWNPKVYMNREVWSYEQRGLVDHVTTVETGCIDGFVCYRCRVHFPTLISFWSRSRSNT